LNPSLCIIHVLIMSMSLNRWIIPCVVLNEIPVILDISLQFVIAPLLFVRVYKYSSTIRCCLDNVRGIDT